MPCLCNECATDFRAEEIKFFQASLENEQLEVDFRKIQTNPKLIEIAKKELNQMVNANEIYPSRFLNGSNIGELELKPLTIEKTEVEKLGSEGNQKNKLILTLKETDKLLALNKTNTATLVKKFGEETENWKGKTITIVKVQVNYQNQIRDSLQVRA